MEHLGIRRVVASALNGSIVTCPSCIKAQQRPRFTDQYDRRRIQFKWFRSQYRGFKSSTIATIICNQKSTSRLLWNWGGNSLTAVLRATMITERIISHQ